MIENRQRIDIYNNGFRSMFPWPIITVLLRIQGIETKLLSGDNNNSNLLIIKWLKG